MRYKFQISNKLQILNSNKSLDSQTRSRINPVFLYYFSSESASREALKFRICNLFVICCLVFVILPTVMSKRWNVKPFVSSVYAGQPHMHPVVAHLLHQRGVQPGNLENFLHPKYDHLYDPFLFTDMRKAVDRIWLAIEQDERMAIYADYDADAVTANAVLQQTFRYLGVEVGSYIPDRFTEGYGLNKEAFEKLKLEGVTLVITVDCGTNSVDVAEYCNQNGIDLIITDHHEITGETPHSYALINPKNPTEQYPDSQITGVGVAYKLAVALLNETEKVIDLKGIPEEEYVAHWDKWLLDLVAIGTVADCHSLMGENRIIVKYGLMVLAKTKWAGLRALLQSAVGINPPELTTHTLGFSLAPRINAAGRLEHANIALDTLLATDPVVAGQAAQALEKVNERRQQLTERLISEAREQAALQAGHAVLVLASPEWPKGVVGIAAGRLATELQKPVIVLEQGEVESTGSARTYGDFDMVEALKATAEYLLKYGGHKQAAGLTLATQNLENFRVALSRYANEHMGTVGQETVLELDAELTSEDLSLDFFDKLEELQPFGVGNPKPVFLIRNAELTGTKKVGNDKHAQLTFSVSGKPLQGIAFNMAYVCDTVPVGSQVDIAGELIADTWNGVRRLKVRVVDVRLAA